MSRYVAVLHSTPIFRHIAWPDNPIIAKVYLEHTSGGIVNLMILQPNPEWLNGDCRITERSSPCASFSPPLCSSAWPAPPASPNRPPRRPRRLARQVGRKPWPPQHNSRQT